MHFSSHLAALAASLATASAIATGPFQGFNYGSSGRQQADFEAAFKAAQALTGAPAGGFHSARLYTMIQDGTGSDPISAIPAAISTKTSLLLGLWCSAGDAVFANEINALKAAIAQYGSSLADLVAGISVGSEDLYRITPTGIANKENPGVGPDVLARYIKQVRDTIANTPLAGAPVGHVDTWTAWVNGSNKAVVDASDFLGLDAYPYFQTTQTNTIENSKALFFDAVGQTQNAAGGKPIWVTETGQPVSGKVSGQSTASKDNAQKYWRDVGCSLFGSTNTWWYTLDDAGADPSFGIVSTLGGAPIFDLSCKDVVSTPSSTGTGSGSSSSGSSTGLPSGSGSGSGSGTSGLSSGSAAAPSATGSLTAAPNAGSPGLSTGLPSAQSSHGSGSNSTSVAAPTGSSGSGSGSSSTSSTGSGTSATPTITNQNAAVMQQGSIFAVLTAVAIAMLAL